MRPAEIGSIAAAMIYVLAYTTAWLSQGIDLQVGAENRESTRE